MSLSVAAEAAGLHLGVGGADRLRDGVGGEAEGGGAGGVDGDAHLLLRRAVEVDELGAGDGAERVGQRLGLAGEAGGGLVRRGGDGEDRGVAARAFAVEFGLEDARGEFAGGVGQRVADLGPDLFDVLGRDRLLEFHRDDRDGGGGGGGDLGDLGDRLQLLLDLRGHERFDAGGVGAGEDGRDGGEDVGDRGVLLPPDGDEGGEAGGDDHEEGEDGDAGVAEEERVHGPHSDASTRTIWPGATRDAASPTMRLPGGSAPRRKTLRFGDVDDLDRCGDDGVAVGAGFDRHDRPAAARAFLERGEGRPEAGLGDGFGEDQRGGFAERGVDAVGQRHDDRAAAGDGVEVGAELEDGGRDGAVADLDPHLAPRGEGLGEVRGHAHAQARGGGVEEAEHGLARRDGLSGVGEAGADAGVEGGADLRPFRSARRSRRSGRGSAAIPASARARVRRASSCAASDAWPRSASVSARPSARRASSASAARAASSASSAARWGRRVEVSVRASTVPAGTRSPSSASTSVRRPPNSKLTSLVATASIWPVKRRSTV